MRFLFFGRNTVVCVPRFLYFLVFIFAFEYTTCILACSLWFITKKKFTYQKTKEKLKIQNQCGNCFFLHVKSFLQLVATLHGFSSVICDKIKQSAERGHTSCRWVCYEEGAWAGQNWCFKVFLLISVVLKDFRILELCVYLLLFFFSFFFNKKNYECSCVYIFW